MIFEAAEKRDATRLDDVRELNRETLRTTGETLSDVSTPTNMVQRILRNEESCKSLVMCIDMSSGYFNRLDMLPLLQEELDELRPARYLDRREFKDDD